MLEKRADDVKAHCVILVHLGYYRPNFLQANIMRVLKLLGRGGKGGGSNAGVPSASAAIVDYLLRKFAHGLPELLPV